MKVRAAKEFGTVFLTLHTKHSGERLAKECVIALPSRPISRESMTKHYSTH
jgi:hypothetical protein